MVKQNKFRHIYTMNKIRMKINTILILLTLIVFTLPSCGQDKKPILIEYNEVTSGAAQIDSYLHLLKDKRIAIVANQTSLLGSTHLVDTLSNLNLNISKIFCPEHGFRGKADAGSLITDGVDNKTGIPIISLYGSHKKPTVDDLKDIEIVLFDLQDVGTRFYTYISTMTYVMEACAENGIPIIILDRPNPNGYFVDGPILEEKHKSFVGLHPIPVVYGMTIGEYARMVAGEKWINKASEIDLSVIELKSYNHNMIVKLQVKPSPNLPNWQSVYLYPSLCFFEGTVMSIGRGTDFPFQVFGHPKYMIGSFVFKPDSTSGSANPKFKNENCFGANLDGYAQNYKNNKNQINLSWLLGTYEQMSHTGEFFLPYFEKLTGTDEFRKQIQSGLSEEEIRKSLKPGIDSFMKIRSKYLIYD